jgi:hypothetical protein
VDQTAVLEIDYSDTMVPPEQVDLPVGPRTTACLDLEVSGVAVIKSIVRALDLHGGNGNDVLFVGNGACGLPPGLLPSVNMQLTVRYDGVPTIGLLLPAVQSVREGSRR